VAASAVQQQQPPLVQLQARMAHTLLSWMWC
jgi:hypothetical protein